MASFYLLTLLLSVIILFSLIILYISSIYFTKVYKNFTQKKDHRSGPLYIVSKKLSIFIDESGDFGPLKPHAPYYLVTMILHNQDVDISENIKALESHLHNLNFDYKAVHTGPIIRREEIYKIVRNNFEKNGSITNSM